MKKVIKIVFYLILIILLLSAVACRTQIQLDIPQNLAVISDVFEWGAVSNASGYEVSIDEEIFYTENNYFILSDIQSGSYSLKVRSIGKGSYIDSDFSEVYTYTKQSGSNNTGLERLPTPSIIIINGEGLMQWRSVTGASGYRIYINNMPFHTISGGGVTSYILNLTEPGSYSIQLQATGVSGQNLDSQKSSSYGFVIKADGTAKLPPLAKPVLLYNYEFKALEWQKNTLAESYIVMVDGVIIADAEITESANTMRYSLNILEGDIEYTIKALGDNIAYEDSLLSNAIRFPLEVNTSPENMLINIINIEDNRRLALTWQKTNYSYGYLLKANDIEIFLEDTYYDFSELADGDYLVKIKSIGDDLYYNSSPFSKEVQIKIVDSKIFMRLDIPQNIGYSGGVVSWSEVEDANGYTIRLKNLTTQLTEDIVISENEYALTSGVIDTYIVSIKANGDNLFEDSIWSNEIATPLSDTYQHIKMITSISYTEEGLSWQDIEDAYGYLLVINEEEITLTQSNYDINLLEGSYIVMVKVLSSIEGIDDSPFYISQIIVPITLATPTIEFFGDILYYNEIENASSYTIYSNDIIIAEEVYSSYFDLRNAITIDGEYYISIKANGEGIFADSPRSFELKYVKTDAEEGTKYKPIAIGSVSDFLKIVNAPDAHYTITATMLDFAEGGKKMELEPLFNNTIPFRGVIKGNGCVIKNINLVENNGISGIFGVLSGAYIESLIITDITLSGTLSGNNAGIIASSAYDSTIKFINVTTSVNVTINSANIGVFAGFFDGEIANCNAYVNIIVTGNNNNVGGIVGSMNGVISNTAVLKLGGYNRITVNGSNTKAGGVVANLITDSVTGINSNTNININGSNVVVGGLFGYSELSAITASSFSGNINSQGNGTTYVGGICGQLIADNVNNIILSGSITSTANIGYVGGIAASLKGEVENIIINTLAINVTADFSTVGGLFAVGTAKVIDDIEATIILEAEATELTVGGLAANATATVTNCVLNIDMMINGKGIAGGMFAVLLGDIENVDAVVDLDSIGDVNIGGLVGELNGNITNSTLKGVLQAKGADIIVGGVAAQSVGLIEDITIGCVSQEFELIFDGQDILAGGVSGMHAGDIQATIYVVITAEGSGIIGGAAGQAAGEFDININSNITAEDATIGGVFGILNGGFAGVVNSKIIASGTLIVGGVAAYNYANIDAVIDTQITVNLGYVVIVGGIAGIDFAGITASITYEFDISAQEGDIGGAIGLGNSEYDIIAEGNIYFESINNGEVRIGGIAGYADKISGKFVGDIEAVCDKAKIGGIAGLSNYVFDAEVIADLIISGEDALFVGVIAGDVDYSYNCNPNGSSINVNGNAVNVGAYGKAYEISDIVITDIAINAVADTLYYGIIAGSVNTINNVTIGEIDAPLTIDITSDTAYIGGVAGVVSYGGSFNQVYSYTIIDVDAQTAYVGGLAALGHAFTECISHSIITVGGDNALIGGIAGELVSASAVYFAGNITTDANAVTAGGFVGEGIVDILDSYVNAKMQIDAVEGKAGLFGGYITGVVTSCYATGSIASESLIELTDYSDATINFAYIDVLTILENKVGIVATLGYNRGYLAGFGHNWTMKEDSYPILEPLVAVQSQENSAVVADILESINLDTDISVNELLPSAAQDGLFDLVTWVSTDTDKIKIIGGNIYRYEQGIATLNGMISGGSIAYSVDINVTEDIIVGTGVELDAYVIDSIKWLHYLDLYKNAWFIFDSDLDISYYPFNPIGDEAEPFSGNIQGNEHTIYGLSIKENYAYSGFFGALDGAVISDLRIENALLAVNQADYAGIFAGYVNDSELTNITASGIFTVSNALYAGGLIGLAQNSVLTYLGYNGTNNINYCDFAGGLIGSSINSVISNAYANAELITESDICYGGLVGYIDNTSSVTFSYAATTAIAVDGSIIAGLIYENSGNIKDSYAVLQANISAYSFAYINTGLFEDCYAILPTFIKYTLVQDGIDTGITALSVMDAVGALFEEDINWDVQPNKLPRLADIVGQSGVSTPIANTQSISIVDMDIFDLADYIEISSGVFGVAKLTSDNIDKLYFDENGYAIALENAAPGELFVTFSFEGSKLLIIEIAINNTPNPDFYSGYGTQLSPFIINTAEQFAKIGDYPYAYFELDNNITIGSSYIRGDFAGYLNGNGYTVTTSKSVFDTATGAITSLNINANITISNTQYAAVLTDYAYDLAIYDMTVSYMLNAQNVNYAGGIFAYGYNVYISDIILDNCVLVATGEELKAGGVAAQMTGNYPYEYFAIERVTGSLNLIAELDSGDVGGIVGYGEYAISDIDIDVTLNVTGNNNIYIGGIVGRSESECVDIFIIADIEVSASAEGVYVGGIAGDINTVNNAHVLGDSIILICNYDNSYIDYTDYPLMTVIFFGGIAGNMYSGNTLSVVDVELSIDISVASLTMDYNALYAMSGGIVGMCYSLYDAYFDSTLNLAINGSVEGEEKNFVSYIGAIAGYLFTAKNLSAEGTINVDVSGGSIAYIGGIVGWLYGEYCERFALAFAVSRIEYIINTDEASSAISGGIAGVNDTDHHDIEGCEHEHVASFVFIYCYYDSDLYAGDLFGEGELDEDTAVETLAKDSLEIVDALNYPESAILIATEGEPLSMDCWQRDIWTVTAGRIPYIDGRNI